MTNLKLYLFNLTSQNSETSTEINVDGGEAGEVDEHAEKTKAFHRRTEGLQQVVASHVVFRCATTTRRETEI